MAGRRAAAEPLEHTPRVRICMAPRAHGRRRQDETHLGLCRRLPHRLLRPLRLLLAARVGVRRLGTRLGRRRRVLPPLHRSALGLPRRQARGAPARMGTGAGKERVASYSCVGCAASAPDPIAPAGRRERSVHALQERTGALPRAPGARTAARAPPRALPKTPAASQSPGRPDTCQVIGRGGEVGEAGESKHA